MAGSFTKRRNPEKLQKRPFSIPMDKLNFFLFIGLFRATVEYF